MTPAERLALQRLNRRAAQLAPELVAALLTAMRAVREQLSVAEVERLIRAGRLSDAVNAAVPLDQLERALAPASVVLTEGTLTAARATTPLLPLAARQVIADFTVLNPRILDAVRRLDTTQIRSLAPEIRQSVRETIEAGLTRGLNPRTVARSLSGTIGLAPNQAAAVRNFRAALEAGDLAKVRRYALRDARFSLDTLTPSRIDTMVAAYERRMFAFNAETHARTAALEAQRVGQRLAWAEAKESGALGEAEVYKRWVATQDARTRDEHAAMHGQEVPLDQPYSTGQMYPGEGEYNCRCAETYVERRPRFAIPA